MLETVYVEKYMLTVYVGKNKKILLILLNLNNIFLNLNLLLLLKTLLTDWGNHNILLLILLNLNLFLKETQ